MMLDRQTRAWLITISSQVTTDTEQEIYLSIVRDLTDLGMITGSQAKWLSRFSLPPTEALAYISGASDLPTA